MASKSLNRGSGGDRSSKVYSRKSQNNNKISSKNLRQPTSSSSKKTLEKQPPQLSRFDAAASDDSSSLNRRQLSSRGGADTAPPSIYTFPLQLENRVIINVSTKLKQELREIRRKLITELDQVRNLVKKLEAKESQLSSASNNYSNSQLSSNYVGDNGGGSGKREKFKAPLPRLSVSSMEDSQLTDNNAQKETNKKAKLNSGKKRSGEGNGGSGLDNNSSKVFKNCSDLLAKLMKHKHGWVFNTPVDVKGLGLRDYYVIIKKPMDLGTVKSKLNKNGYKSPSEFAEDVKLTFDNAMTYNRKGQDVHIMAEELLKIFEDKWVGIQAESNRKSKSTNDHEVGVPKSKSIGKRSFSPPHLPETKRNYDRSESPIVPVDTQLKPSDAAGSGRIAAPKKPKASDINKREMTYEEKQRLSTNLQSLPLDKLDNVVQIIKNRNSSLLHNDDEIEVDIDSVDTETLWELDRFVTNYRKGLGKKRKAENVIQPIKESEQIVEETKPDPPTVEPPKDKETALDINEKDISSSSPVQEERREEAATRSSSSSSSSSDSGSSSSDSDTDSSSASDS